ncbi:hypothetical protein L6164_027364 [Bauhinia variegata]|uniref:Uncharacterized protein n=1 Tax=Bauhinia variegata TaxID=167791 RepID=A0ACB9LT35_BAUVA|nr:hypothetical protein L6164_027364 [Bauhinia variegata]
MEPQQEFEWNEAQKIAIGVDLVAVAKQQLQFLAAVDRNRHLYDGPALERAIYRYNACWLPLLAKHTESRIFEGPLVAPLDCEWVWHCHRLNPVRYKSDCEELYGQILDSSNVVSSIEGINATQTEKTWNKMYPDEPYNIDLMNVSSEDISERINKLAKYTKYDLVSAAKRQTPFVYQVSRPHMKNDLFIEEAVARYKGFLHLIKRNKEKGLKRFCVPTYDVDLIWHSHQLHPVAYCKDLNEALGKVLEHDDTDSDRTKGKKLDTGFSGTSQQWEKTFGSRYWKAGAMYRGNTPSPVTRNLYSPNTIRKVVSGCPLEIQLPERKIVEVQLEFVAVKNLPDGQKGSLFVLFSKSQPDAFFNAKRNLSIFSESGVKQVASFQCEPTGELLFELMSHSSSKLSLRKSSKTLGTASFSVQDCFDPISTFSVEKWLELLPSSGNMSSNPILLRVAISFTAPAPAPYMLEMSQSQPFSENSCFFTLPVHAKSWTHFTDETGSEVISLQMRDLKKAKDICITGKEVIGLLKSGETRTLAEFSGNEWSVMDNLWLFHIQNKCRDDDHLFELISGTRMVKVFSGRKLDYETRHCGKYGNEIDYLTAVEFSVEDPYGRAVALFDLRSGFVKAKEKWMVLPGIILAFIISNILRKEGYKGYIATSKDLKMNASTEKVSGMELNGNVASVDARIAEKTGLSSSGGCGAGGCGGDIMKSSGCGGCGAGGCGGGCGSENMEKSGGCGGCGAGCGGGCGEGSAKKSAGCGGCGGGCGGCGGGILESKCSVDEQVENKPNHVHEAAVVA